MIRFLFTYFRKYLPFQYADYQCMSGSSISTSSRLEKDYKFKPEIVNFGSQQMVHPIAKNNFLRKFSIYNICLSVFAKAIDLKQMIYFTLKYRRVFLVESSLY